MLPQQILSASKRSPHALHPAAAVDYEPDSTGVPSGQAAARACECGSMDLGSGCGLAGPLDGAAPHTGTTIVAALYDGGVVIAADSRVSTGTYVSNRASDKITPLWDNVYLLRSGSAADTQVVSDYGERTICHPLRPPLPCPPVSCPQQNFLAVLKASIPPYRCAGSSALLCGAARAGGGRTADGEDSGEPGAAGAVRPAALQPPTSVQALCHLHHAIPLSDHRGRPDSGPQTPQLPNCSCDALSGRSTTTTRPTCRPP